MTTYRGHHLPVAARREAFGWHVDSRPSRLQGNTDNVLVPRWQRSF